LNSFDSISFFRLHMKTLKRSEGLISTTNIFEN